jgi:hypothetical protein
MCCCRVASCCCGLHDLGPGLQQLVFLSLVINLCMLLAPLLGIEYTFPVINQQGYEVCVC